MAVRTVGEMNTDKMVWVDKLQYIIKKINDGRHEVDGSYAVSFTVAELSDCLTGDRERLIRGFQKSLETSIHTRAVHKYGPGAPITRGECAVNPDDLTLTFIFRVNGAVQYKFSLWGNKTDRIRTLQCFIKSIHPICAVC